MRRSAWAIASLISAAVFGCGTPEAVSLRLIPPALLNAPQFVAIKSGLPYAQRNTGTLLFNLYRPDDNEPRPLVVLIHGGAWVGGERSDLAEVAYDIAAQGYVTASIDYRLADANHFPAPVADVLTAVRYFREHAGEFGIDPARIALLGRSAGANLALLAGMASDISVFDPSLPPGESLGVACIVDLFGPTDLTVDPATGNNWQISVVEDFLGQSVSDPDLHVRQAASPVTYVRPDGPPILIIHGTADTLVPVSQARALADAMDVAGQMREVHIFEGMDHLFAGLWLSPWSQIYRTQIHSFLRAHL